MLIDLIGWNGLRPAEARGLRWSALDEKSGELRVQARLGAWDREIEAETRASVRTIKLDEPSVARLATWRKEQVLEKERSRQAWAETGLIVTTA